MTPTSIARDSSKAAEIVSEGCGESGDRSANVLEGGRGSTAAFLTMKKPINLKPKTLRPGGETIPEAWITELRRQCDVYSIDQVARAVGVSVYALARAIGGQRVYGGTRVAIASHLGEHRA